MTFRFVHHFFISFFLRISIVVVRWNDVTTDESPITMCWVTSHLGVSFFSFFDILLCEFRSDLCLGGKFMPRNASHRLVSESSFRLSSLLSSPSHILMRIRLRSSSDVHWHGDNFFPFPSIGPKEIFLLLSICAVRLSSRADRKRSGWVTAGRKLWENLIFSINFLRNCLKQRKSWFLRDS